MTSRRLSCMLLGGQSSLQTALGHRPHWMTVGPFCGSWSCRVSPGQPSLLCGCLVPALLWGQSRAKLLSMNMQGPRTAPHLRKYDFVITSGVLSHPGRCLSLWPVVSRWGQSLGRLGTRLCDSVPLGSDWTYPAPSAQMFLPHVWFGNLRWIVGERCPPWDGGQRSFLQGVCDQGANGRLAIQLPSGWNSLTDWAGSGGAGLPMRGQCWVPWGWESVRLKVLGWPPPCLEPDTTPVVTQ